MHTKMLPLIISVSLATLASTAAAQISYPLLGAVTADGAISSFAFANGYSQFGAGGFADAFAITNATNIGPYSNFARFDVSASFSAGSPCSTMVASNVFASGIIYNVTGNTAGISVAITEGQTHADSVLVSGPVEGGPQGGGTAGSRVKSSTTDRPRFRVPFNVAGVAPTLTVAAGGVSMIRTDTGNSVGGSGVGYQVFQDSNGNGAIDAGEPVVMNGTANSTQPFSPANTVGVTAGAYVLEVEFATTTFLTASYSGPCGAGVSEISTVTELANVQLSFP